MIENIKKDIGDTVLVKISFYGKEVEKEGIISMITITKKGIKYRAKFENSVVRDFEQEEIIK